MKKLSENTSLTSTSQIDSTVEIVALGGTPINNINIPVSLLVEDSLNSEDSLRALSANQGNILNTSKAPISNPSLVGIVSANSTSNPTSPAIALNGNDASLDVYVMGSSTPIVNYTSVGPSISDYTLQFGNSGSTTNILGTSVSLPSSITIGGLNMLGSNNFISYPGALPSPSTFLIGLEYRFINITTGPLLILSPLAGNINGNTSYTIPANTGITFITDGSNWYTV